MLQSQGVFQAQECSSHRECSRPRSVPATGSAPGPRSAPATGSAPGPGRAPGVSVVLLSSHCTEYSTVNKTLVLWRFAGIPMHVDSLGALLIAQGES